MKVTPIKEAPHVDPLPGWALECEHGHQARDSTPDGSLVRLATVVQWLQESQSLPRVNAVDVLCSKLDERVLGALCRIQSGVFAEPVAHDSRFGFKVSKPAQMSAHLPAAPSFVVPGYLSSFPDRPRFSKATRTKTAGPARPDMAPGLPALLARLRLDWRARPAPKQGECDPLNDKRTLSAFLALPFGLAHELWGWGGIAAPSGDESPVGEAHPPEKVGNYAELLRVRAAAPGAKWLPDMLRALLAEEQARQQRPGAKGVRAALAKELGPMSVQRVGELIRAAQGLPAEPPRLLINASAFSRT